MWNLFRCLTIVWLSLKSKKNDQNFEASVCKPPKLLFSSSYLVFFVTSKKLMKKNGILKIIFLLSRLPSASSKHKKMIQKGMAWKNQFQFSGSGSKKWWKKKCFYCWSKKQFFFFTRNYHLELLTHSFHIKSNLTSYLWLPTRKYNENNVWGVQGWERSYEIHGTSGMLLNNDTKRAVIDFYSFILLENHTFGITFYCLFLYFIFD